MIRRCTNCACHLPEAPSDRPSPGRRIATFPLGPPFPCELSLAEVSCPVCSTRHAVAANRDAHGRDHAWAVADEVLGKDRDYVWASPRGSWVNPNKPLVVAWAWLPTRDAAVSDRLLQALRADCDLRRRDVTSLLMLDGDRLPGWAPDAARLFDCCVVLKGHVLADQFGPYPSLRAERSIVKSFGASGRARVKHYWPSATLDRADYIPLAGDEELLAAWGRHHRAHIEFEFGDTAVTNP